MVLIVDDRIGEHIKILKQCLSGDYGNIIISQFHELIDNSGLSVKYNDLYIILNSLVELSSSIKEDKTMQIIKTEYI